MNVRYKSINFFVLFLLSALISSADNFPLGARSCALGNASVSFSDGWSSQNNQAGLAFLKNNSCAFYHEQRFGLKELSLNAATTAIITKKGVFGISVSSFGYTLYNENKFGIAYARRLSNTFSIGVQVDYFYTHISDEYGNKGVPLAEVGILKKLTNKLSVGVHFFNLSSTKLANYSNERVPTIVRFGMSYLLSKQLLIAVEAEKDIQLKPLLKAGIEYHPRKNIFLRAGISSTFFSFGFGIDIHKFELNIASSFHPKLGYTPEVSMTYHFDKKSN